MEKTNNRFRLEYFVVCMFLTCYSYSSPRLISFDNDSTELQKLKTKTYKSLKKRDTLLFKILNEDLLRLSITLKDSSGLAEYHWNKAAFFKAKEIMDSSYYHYNQAQKFYDILGDTYYSAKMLTNMANVRGRLKDYTFSEVLLFDAIGKFEKLGENKSLHISYNELGLVFTDLSEYSKAIFYFEKALEYLKLIENKKIYQEATLNNLGLVYQKSGDYSRAVSYFEESLKTDSLEGIDIYFYARLIDNLAYSKFLNNDTLNVNDELNKSLLIRDSVKDRFGIVMSKIHLSEYYAFSQDTITAIKYAAEANELAKSIKNNRDYLVSLKLLSELDDSNKDEYLKEYIFISDSLQIAERKIRNKFTRISYETDKYVEETKRLSQQKTLITVGSGIVILILSLLYFLIRQRSKNKELIFEAEQQKNNEEIYQLILSQQAKLEEGGLQERHRISEELHDGVLGRLFGTRMNMGFLDLKGNKDTLKEHEIFLDEIQDIEKEIRTISHELKNEILSTKLDFMTIIKNLIEEQSIIGKYQYTITAESAVYWDEIPDKTKFNIYRVLQESLFNIHKYSEAKNVGIHFKIQDKMLTLTVTDDGIGFDVKTNKKGIGIVNMRARVQRLGGRLNIDSIIDKGTVLTASIPV